MNQKLPTEFNANPSLVLQQPNRSISQKDVAIIFYRKRWLIVGLFLAIFLTVTVATFLKPKTYVARAKILLKKERVNTMVSPSTDMNTAEKPQVNEATINTEVEILQSAILLRDVVSKIGVERLKPKEEGDTSVYNDFEFEFAVSSLKRDLKIRPVPASSIIEVSYESDNALLSAEVVNAVCNLYVDHHLQVYENRGIYSFFQDQADALYDTLQSTSESLREFESYNGLVDPAQQRDLVLQQLTDYESQLDAARMKSEEAERQVRFLEGRMSEEPKRIQTQTRSIRNTVVGSLTRELDSLEVKYRELAMATDDGDEENFHKRARLGRNIRARIAQIEETIMQQETEAPTSVDADIHKSLMGLSDDITRARSSLIGYRVQVNELEGAIQRLKRGLSNLESAKLEHQTLKRQWELTQDNYLLYAKKREEARISEALDREKVANVSIIDPATIPLNPVAANNKLSLVMGFFLALFVSVGTVFGLSYFDNLIRSGNDIERQLNIPVILAIPDDYVLESGMPHEPHDREAFPFAE